MPAHLQLGGLGMNAETGENCRLNRDRNRDSKIQALRESQHSRLRALMV